MDVKKTRCELEAELERARERISALEAAERVARSLSRVIEASLNEIYLFDVERLRFVEVNQGARNNLGYSLDELRLMTPLDIKPEFDLERFRSSVAPLVSGEANKIEFITIHERKDGSRYPVEVRVELASQGSQLFVAIILDISKRVNAEIALQQSRAQLDSFFDASPAGLLVLDSELRYRRVNAALAEINGVSIEGHLGKTIAEVLPELAPTIVPLFQSILDTGEAILNHTVQGEPPGQPGVTRSWNVSYFPLCGADGEIQALGAVIVETTSAHASAIERSLLAEAIEHATDAIVITDAHGILEYVNPAFERITGYQRSEAIGHNARLLKSGEQNKAFYEELWSTLTSGKTWHGDFINLKKDGTRYFEQATISPVIGEDGEIRNFVAVKHDVTEAKRAKTALRDSEERFHQLSEHIDEIFWLGDPKTQKVLYVSPAFERIWQRRAEEVYDDPTVWYSCIHSEDKARVVHAFEEFLKGKADYDLSFRILRPDGSERTLAMRGTLTRDADGAISRAVGSTRDISERSELEKQHRLLEEQYRQSQKMEAIGRLAGGVAHDFNNLLTVINSYAELGVDALKPEDPLRLDLQEILAAGERAGQLTRQLLAFSRKQVLQPRVLDLGEVVSDMHRMLERLLGEDVEFETKLCRDISRISADRGQLEQVLMNLVVNARDAIHSTGKLTIETANVIRQGSTCAMLAVSDTGIGMDAETQKRIFEPFFTTKEVGAGTGLGLATVYGIVNQSEGVIEVESKLGHGTCFKIFLPTVEGEPHVLTPPPPDDLLEQQNHETVLIVEDEDTVRTLTERILRSAGYSVLTAGNGDDALLLCEHHYKRAKSSIDLVLSDVIMPRMRGPQLIEALNQGGYGHIRALYMSGYAGDAIADVLGGGSHFIPKPFTVAGLLEQVRRTLDAEE